MTEYLSPTAYADCPVFYKLKTAGVSHMLADSLCRQSHRIGLTRQAAKSLSAEDIVRILMIKSDNPRIPTSSILSAVKGEVKQNIPDSAYGDDYDSCLESLKNIGISDDRAVEECQTAWKGKGNRGGKLRSASAESETPSWAYAIFGGQAPSLPHGSSPLRSASTIPKDVLAGETMVEMAERKADSRIRQAKLKQAARKDPIDERPAWLRALEP